PAPIMKLVEVISGLNSDAKIVSSALSLMRSWGKQAITAKDVPGFIVNRVARPFYAEGWRALEEGVGDAATLDFIYRDLAGFRMGPFELGDLIGHDINTAAAQSVYDSYFGKTRFRPSLMQNQLVAAGLLGRKTGRGVYPYTDGCDKPEPVFAKPAKTGAITFGPETNRLQILCKNPLSDPNIETGFSEVDGVLIGMHRGKSAAALSQHYGQPIALLDWFAHGQTQSLAYSASSDQADAAVRGWIAEMGKKPIRLGDRPGGVIMRTCLQLLNAAADALRDQVGNLQDIDTAMRYGVNYPFGPFEWAKTLGYETAVKALEHMAVETGEPEFYAPNHVLKALAWSIV
ncbi:MAG TPA: 3-hydroxybutyryl-CoA dehydrogenase, partial [Hellea balneolensis]|nr:3-hydroxybutyryl-CoA dehydrogenase [Hellea balneolensis]